MSRFNQNFISLGRIGKPGGIASLNTEGKLTDNQIPSSILGGLKFKGVWNALTNTPNLNDIGRKINGDLYIVSTEGLQNLGNGSIRYTLNDGVFYSQSENKWYHQQSSVTSAEVLYSNTLVPGLSNVKEALDNVFNAPPSSTVFSNYVQTSVDITLTSNSKPFQFITNTSPIVVTLPSTPNSEKYFCITNYSTSEFIAVTYQGVTFYLFGKDRVTYGQQFPFISAFWNGTTWIFAGPSSFNFIDTSSSTGGTPAYSSGGDTIAIGISSNSSGTNSVAIGSNSNVNAIDSFQLGPGTNVEDSTIKYKNVLLSNSRNTTPYTISVETNSEGPFSAVVGQILLVNSTDPTVVFPPSNPQSLDRFMIVDTRGLAEINNITIVFSSSLRHGANIDKVISSNNGKAEFMYVDSSIGWIDLI